MPMPNVGALAPMRIMQSTVVDSVLLGYFAIDLQHAADAGVPGKFSRLLQSTGLQLVAQGLIDQHTMKRAHDLEHILRIYHDGCVTYDLGD